MKVNLTPLQSIMPLQKVCDVGVIVDGELTMESHVANVVWNSFYTSSVDGH